jgi:hypothetical protein
MKHNFPEQPDGANADRFLAWLEAETIDFLKRSIGDPETTRAAIFLFVNRAYEAHMPEDKIGAMFGKCFVRAGFPEEDEDAAFHLLDFFGQIASRTHSGL